MFKQEDGEEEAPSRENQGDENVQRGGKKRSKRGGSVERTGRSLNKSGGKEGEG